MFNRFLVFILLFVTAGTGSAQNGDAGRMYGLINQYNADAVMLQRKYVIKNSPEYFDRMKRFYSDWLSRMTKQPFQTFATNDRVDYVLLKRNIKRDQGQLLADEEQYKSIVQTIPFAKYINAFEAKRRVGQQQPGKETGASFVQLKEETEQTMKQLEGNSSLSPQQFQTASLAVMDLRRAFNEAFKFYDGYDPQFTKGAKTAYLDADTTLGKYISFLKKKAATVQQKDDGTGIIGNPIGREALIRDLQFEMIPYTPEQLEAIAMQEFAWCDKEMLKAAQQMGFGNNWKAALEKVKNNYVEIGKQPELAKFLAEEAITFIEQRQLVTIPEMAKEGWRMRMLTPAEQKFAPFFLGGEQILIAYPTEDMNEADRMMTLRGNNRHFSRAVVHHELIPGHNLQYYMNSRYKPYRSSFRTSFWGEGWALWWEMLLWDNHFATTPEDKIGMLFWRMHRCARIIFSINYHTNKWTPKQCIDFLVDRVGHEPANAEAEVRRSFTGGYGPLYQVAYMLGGLQFKALHTELVKSGKMSNKTFHDRILKEHNMPIEMVRAVLINQPLKENHVTGWKFAGEVK
nr:DUF885 family protein [uncultured Lacibacter sp.]